MVNMAQLSAVEAGALRSAVLDPHRRGEREAAEAAVRALIRWAGDDPEREGLAETPARVARAFEAYFSGYGLDPVKELSPHLLGIGGLQRARAAEGHRIRLAL